MGKKKQKHSATPFKNNPFDSVKGFSVSPAKAAPVVEKKEEPAQEKTQTGVESEVDFNQAMSQLGVVTMDESEPVREKLSDDIQQLAKPSPKPPTTDEEIFLDGLGELDCVFTDDYDDFETESVQSQSGEPRRMKQLRQGKLKPQETLDLHGCYRDEAREKVRHFLKNHQQAGLQTVLIITGRGNRSPKGESVLRSDVERYLTTQAGAWVVEWGRAPRQYGGEGALVVFLRQTK